MNKILILTVVNIAGVFFGGVLVGAGIVRYKHRGYVEPNLLAFDLLDCAMKENAKYEELREYAEMAYNVRMEALSGEELPEDVLKEFSDDMRHETIEVIKHAHARDALMAFYNTAPYIAEKTPWPQAAEYEDVYLADGLMKHSRSEVHAKHGMTS